MKLCIKYNIPTCFYCSDKYKLKTLRCSIQGIIDDLNLILNDKAKIKEMFDDEFFYEDFCAAVQEINNEDLTKYINKLMLLK